jgi:opacity protein-like surface antigen
MGSLKTLALAGAVLAGATAVASAADLGRPPMGLPPAPIAAPIAEASGWYLRGDIGIGALNSGKYNYSDNPAGLVFGQKDYQHQIFGGIGVGYQFNSWLRFDVTGEYRGKTGFSVNDTYAGRVTGRDCNGAVNAAVDCGFTGGNRNTGNISSTVFLANGYVDLGTWQGITPFIGAGAGMTQNRVSGVNDIGYNINTLYTTGTNTVLGAATSPSSGYAANGTKSGFAYALMAGLAYDVSPNYKVELAYRYLNLGKFQTGNYTCVGGCTSTYSLQGRSLDSHEFKVGMRWMLGGPTYSPAPAPMPYPAHVTKKF